MEPCEQSDPTLECSPHSEVNGLFPYSEKVIFQDSYFFQKPHAPTSLPSPAEVRENQSMDPHARNIRRPRPVRFPSMGLLVKYGTEITIAEAQCLLFIRRTLQTVPVPEVYGWCKDDNQVFIYMELMDGNTLEKSWEIMVEDDRLAICQQLRHMIDAWRSLENSYDPPFIGHVGKQPLLDIIFTDTCSQTAGPFSSVTEFHNWFTSTFGPNRDMDVEDISTHPYRSFIPDDFPIVFTHGDLHPSNIIVSLGPNPRVVAIVDWHQSGWYPSYWEYCKARWTSWIGKEWEANYLPLLLDRHDCYDYWDYFVLARGA
ncbi:kinase-like protein [Dothidotthia symphoricarpi CBS 119687]|uniref:Kinase-like protein n=1 Tax=Dothidotthia symphoricarpi CBS 119687 TaxID=1392245 RepID=A0A6A5ZXE7_9PLEO|nr:kinase-like protein [Dothidotthia symphoricarpi CBS 119687]KAF2123946.1 kinase-like protein [Dothidotthia symphoricarpi CBS 119687]